MLSRELKRRFVVSLAAVTAFSMFGNTVLAQGFIDTDGTDFDAAFAYLKEEGIVQGYSDGLARPANPLNRVEALKVIIEAQGKHVARVQQMKGMMPAQPLFFDTRQTDWYAPYIEVGFEKGIITGYPDGSFRPGQLLAVEEAVTMLMRTFNDLGATTPAELSNYIENQPNQWYTPAINAAIERSLIMHKGKLKLGTAITRGQFFDIVYRLHSIKASGEVVFTEPTPTVHTPIIQSSSSSSSSLSVQTFSNDELPTPYALRPNPNPSPSPQVEQFPTPSLPQNVTIAPKINHQYASEKYFAITMPSLGVYDLTITHPEDAVSKDGVLSVLKDGVGHLFAYPGGGGKIMVYGHSSGYPWDVSEYTKIFRRINELQPGDRVYVTYAGTLYIYEVSHEQTIIAKDAHKAFQDQGEGEELVLFTCWPPDSIAQRYLVHAVPVETVAAQ